MNYKVGDTVVLKGQVIEYISEKIDNSVIVDELIDNFGIYDYITYSVHPSNRDGSLYYSDSDIDHEATELLKSSQSSKSLRYNKGKPEFSHLSPAFIMEMMKTMTKANEKYPYLNYCKKQDVKTASDSLMRHYLKFQMGEDLDDETSCHHLAHLAVNAMIIFQNLQDFGDEVDNRYEKAKRKEQDGD